MLTDVMSTHRRSRGQSLAEFALVMPIFILMLLAVFDFGRAVFAYNSVTNAAREGSRIAIVNQDLALIEQRTLAQSAMGTEPDVTVSFRKSTPNRDYTANATCSPITLDCVAIIDFEITYRPITPVVAAILFPSGVTMAAQSVGQVEFVCPNSATASAACPKQP